MTRRQPLGARVRPVLPRSPTLGPVREWFGLVARLVTGGVWLYAAIAKLPDPAGSVRSVRAYELLPESLVPLVGHALPALELALGIALVVGALTRWSGLLSALLLVAFIIGISAAWYRGLQIDCGCFGDGGLNTNAAEEYPWEIARDVGLLLLSGWLVWWPRTRLSIDGLIFGSRGKVVNDEHQPA